MHWFERQRTHKFTNHWVLKIIEVYQLPTPTPSEIPNLQQPGDFTWRSNNGKQQSIFSKIKIHHLDIYTVYNWVIWGIDICNPSSIHHVSILLQSIATRGHGHGEIWPWPKPGPYLRSLFSQLVLGEKTTGQIRTSKWWDETEQTVNDFDQTISDVKATTATSTSVVQWLKFVSNGHTKHIVSV